MIMFFIVGLIIGVAIERELTKEELGCAMIITLVILIGVVAFWYSYN